MGRSAMRQKYDTHNIISCIYDGHHIFRPAEDGATSGGVIDE